MLKDTDVVLIVCERCGHESQKKVGWLRARAGRAEFVCVACGGRLEHHTKQFLFVADEDTANLVRKLRLQHR